jgi:hypothetical protein
MRASSYAFDERFWVLLTLIASGACAAGTPAMQIGDTPDGSPSTEWIVGQWQITAENGTGPQLTISIDAATATTLNGHVMRFMSGDMGVGPGEFRPFSVSTRPDEPIELTIEMVDAQPSTRIQLQLRRTAADLEVLGFRLGAEDMTANNRVWIARKRM